MNNVDYEIIGYLERANAIMQHCRDNLVIEHGNGNDEHQRLEIAKMIQAELLREAIKDSKQTVTITGEINEVSQ